jgi:hypothetical protein
MSLRKNEKKVKKNKGSTWTGQRGKEKYYVAHNFDIVKHVEKDS